MSETKNIAEVLFGQTRLRVLGLFFCPSAQALHLRAISRRINVSPGPLHRELTQLVACGLLVTRKQGNKLVFEANPTSDIYSEMCQLWSKLLGSSDAILPEPKQSADSPKIVFGAYDRDAEQEAIVLL